MADVASAEAGRVGPLGLPGEVTLPAHTVRCVVFVHGSGSGRSSPKNRFLASVLQQHRLATLVFNLLTQEEAEDRSLVFDIALLMRRLEIVPGASHLFEEPGALNAVAHPATDWFMRHSARCWQ